MVRRLGVDRTTTAQQRGRLINGVPRPREARVGVGAVDWFVMSGWNNAGPATVLVADDEADIRALVSESLQREGYSVVECSDGRAALARLVAGDIDLVVLDLGLPSLPGLDVLTDLRRTSEIPVIILSGRGEESDRILGLKLGADDYLAKPFSPRELVARVESVLRRSRPRSPGQRLEFPGLAIDTTTREVVIDGEWCR